MKRIISLILIFSFILTACASNQASVETGSGAVVTSMESTVAVAADTDADIETKSSDGVLPEEVSVSESRKSEDGLEDVVEKTEDSENGNTESQDAERLKEYAVRYQQIEDQEIADENLDLSDERLQQYLKDRIYQETITSFDSDQYIIDNIETTYYSREYIDNLAYNSLENVYFGFTQAELDQQFAGKKYVFTLGENGETTVQEVQSYEDHTTEEVLKNVAIGSGVLLVSVTVSTATMGVAPAVGMIFAVGAKTGTAMAISGGTIGGISAGVLKGYQTGNFEDAMKAAAVGASDGFKWGAITGALSGGASETWGLFKATEGGLTMNKVAILQKETKYPLDVIKNFHSLEEGDALRAACPRTMMVDGKIALVQDIDLNYVDDVTGKTNLQLMKEGKAPIDPMTKEPFELHHIGQQVDSPLAVLNWEQHRGKGSFKTLHEFLNKVGSENPSCVPGWDKQRADFWIDMAKQLGGVV